MTMKMIKKRWDILLAIAIFIILNTILYKYQQQISFNDGLEWDGVYYANITNDFLEGRPIKTEQPFVNRIAVPFLASLMGSDIINNWRVLNLVANVLILFFLYILLQKYIFKKWLRFCLLLLLLLPFHSVVRRVWFAPVSADHWDKVFLIAGLIVLHEVKTKSWNNFVLFLFCTISFIGVFFREIVFILPIAGLWVHNPMSFRNGYLKEITVPNIKAFLPVFSGLLGLILVKDIVATGDHSFFLRTAIFWLYTKNIPEYILAWYIAFGPILVFPVVDIKQSVRFLGENQHLLAYLAAVALLSFIGGSATYRLLHWALPIVLILVGKAVQNTIFPIGKHKIFFLFLFTVTYFISQRVFWLLPDYPGGISNYFVFLTPLSSAAPFLDVVGMGDVYTNRLALVSYLIVFTILTLTLYWPKITIKDLSSDK